MRRKKSSTFCVQGIDIDPETLRELRRQLFGTASEKIISKEKDAEETKRKEEETPITQ